MDNVIEVEDKIYALHSPMSELCEEGKTQWYGKPYFALQGSRMHYGVKEFATHKHKLNPRIINKTQEAFIVVKGAISIEIYEKLPLKPNYHEYKCLGILTAKQGDVIFVWDGFHKLKFLEEGTVAYEIKAGQFTCVSDDKEIAHI